MFFGPLELEKYRDAVKELLWIHPAIGFVARSMGEPVFSDKDATAFLELDDNKQIRFNCNPDFVVNTDVDQVAAVIAHESYHLVLEHYKELQDKATFPQTETLVKAQEIIVNDIIENIYHMKMPDWALRGLEILGQDCSQYTSKQVYDMLVQEGEGQGEGDDDQDQKGDGQAGGQGSGGDGDQDGQEEKHGCGGLHGGDSSDGSSSGAPTAQEMQQAFEDLVDQAAAQEGVSSEDLKNDLQNDHSGGFSLSGPVGGADGSLSRERMNWKHLLAKINPKIMDSGKPKRRTRNNWLKPNRRMNAVYPQIILPVIEPIANPNDDDGNTIPSFVIALDLSGSIPRDLVDTLQGLLEDIPSDLINAYPCTWSSELLPYDEVSRRVVRSGGTHIQLVVNYVNQIIKDTDSEPYVLVITDGEIYGDYQRPGNDWYFMAVNDRSMYQCVQQAKGDKEKVYNVKDFKV